MCTGASWEPQDGVVWQWLGQGCHHGQGSLSGSVCAPRPPRVLLRLEDKKHCALGTPSTQLMGLSPQLVFCVFPGTQGAADRDPAAELCGGALQPPKFSGATAVPLRDSFPGRVWRPEDRGAGTWKSDAGDLAQATGTPGDQTRHAFRHVLHGSG